MAWDGVRALGLKLYDQDRGRMVTFRDAHATRGAAATTAGGARVATRCPIGRHGDRRKAYGAGSDADR